MGRSSEPVSPQDAIGPKFKGTVTTVPIPVPRSLLETSPAGFALFFFFLCPLQWCNGWFLFPLAQERPLEVRGAKCAV